MATLAAPVAISAARDTVGIPVPRRLLRRFGSIAKLTELLERIEQDAAHLEEHGGGQLQASIDVQRDGRVADVYTAPRRRL